MIFALFLTLVMWKLESVTSVIMTRELKFRCMVEAPSELKHQGKERGWDSNSHKYQKPNVAPSILSNKKDHILISIEVELNLAVSSQMAIFPKCKNQMAH